MNPYNPEGPYHHHQHPPAGAPVPYAPQLQGELVKIFCKADRTYNLGIRNEAAVIVPSDSDDETQLWIKDVSYGARTKDNYGSPAFALVNKAQRKALKHSKEKGQQVILVDYRPGMQDEDILWTESQDFGEGYKTVRSAYDTLLNLTLFQEEKKGGLFHHSDKHSTPEVKEGCPVVLDTWHKGDHQLWKIFNL
eukprot:c23364_g1_i1 orf=760-1338(-)